MLLEITIELLKNKKLNIQKELKERSKVSELKKETASEVPAQEQLTEKDLYCIARHIKELINFYWRENKEDFNVSCYDCKFSNSCGTPEDKNSMGFRVLDPWVAFMKLAKTTGINISRFSKKRLK